MFADDLVLISRTRIRGMNRLLRAVHRFCQDMHMKLSVDKTVMLSTGTGSTSWKISDSEPTLESALVARVRVGVGRCFPCLPAVWGVHNRTSFSDFFSNSSKWVSFKIETEFSFMI